MAESLTYFELGTQTPKAVIICFHGLGASARKLADAMMQLTAHPHLRFVFPDAPIRPVTVNQGLPMRAWYDIRGFGFDASEDDIGLRSTHSLLEPLVQDQINRGITAQQIFLAGFSQGGALALYSGLRFAQRLAGIIALSGYLPRPMLLAREANSTNRQTPIFMAHGLHDTVLLPALARYSYECLQALHYPVEFYTYPMDHCVCNQEVDDLITWLHKVVPEL